MAPKYTDDQRTLQTMLATRSSVRHFASDPIPDEVVADLVKLALRAPTSINSQPYACILVRKQKDRERLAEAMHASNITKVKTAPMVAVFCADLEPSRRAPRTQDILREEGYPDSFIDAIPQAIRHCSGDGIAPGEPRNSSAPTIAWSYKQATFAATTFLFAAVAHGLATCPIEGFDEAKTKEILKVPARYAIPVMIVCGYSAPQANHGMTKRFDVDELFYDGEFGVNDPKLTGKP